MANSDYKSIVAFYLDKLHSIIPSTGSIDFVFRGLENKDWGLESSAYRRYVNRPTHAEFIQYNCDLIARAKNANYHIKENSDLEEIELLAELRHYGAATALIDFTRDFLVALWFASKPYKKNEISADGKVIIVNIGNSEVFLELTSEDKQRSLEDILKFKTRGGQDTPEIAPFDDGTKMTEIRNRKQAALWYWQPRFEINHRLSAQKGVFIFGKAAIDTTDMEYWEVIISQEDKDTIHQELSDHFGIKEDSLFNDLPGFAMVNDIGHELQTRSADDYYQDAVQHFQRGEFGLAITYIDKAMELDSDQAAHYFLRSQTNRELKRYEDALSDATKAIDLDSSKAAHYFLRSQTNRELKKYEDALSDATKAIELDSSKAAHYFIRGQINHDLNRTVDSLRDFTMSIRLVFDEAYYYYSRGDVNYELEKYEDALRDFTKAIELQPDEIAYCYAYRGFVYRDLEKHEDALRDFNKAIELEPDYAYFHCIRGLIYRDLGKFEDALRNTAKAIEMEPDKAIHYYSRSEVFRDLKRYEDALGDINKAIDLDPGIGNHYFLRGQVNRDLGKHEDAQRDFDKAKQLEPNLPKLPPEDN